MKALIQSRGLRKGFVLHTQGNVRIPVFRDFRIDVMPGESVGLVGPSGAGKSTLLRLLYGNYRSEQGTIRIWHKGAMVDLAAADPHTVLDVRRWTIGYVSQFLRVVPRVPALQVVMEPLQERGVDRKTARARAEELLVRLRIPRRLWQLSPTTFSGGEQQRINLARGFAAPYPLLLLDEPTASLDPKNRATVIAMIQEVIDAGSAVIGIFHDEEARERLATRVVEIDGSSKNGLDMSIAGSLQGQAEKG
ncbi:MAG: phosphonate C-P lyase system protein PhnL [Desulfobacteraceae bacterium]